MAWSSGVSLIKGKICWPIVSDIRKENPSVIHFSEEVNAFIAFPGMIVNKVVVFEVTSGFDLEFTFSEFDSLILNMNYRYSVQEPFMYDLIEYLRILITSLLFPE